MRGAFEPVPSFTTDRLVIRPPMPGDWRQWASVRAASRDFLTRWEPAWGPDHLSKRSFRRRLRMYRRDNTIRAFFLFRREDDQLLGGVTLGNIRFGVVQSASFGYWLGETFTGQGYMSEALDRLIRYAFDDLKLHRLEAVCIPENAPSRRILERLGFREEGYLRAYLKINGAWEDHVLYGLLKADRAGPEKGPETFAAATAYTQKSRIREG